jgi:hypothetical protein
MAFISHEAHLHICCSQDAGFTWCTTMNAGYFPYRAPPGDQPGEVPTNPEKYQPTRRSTNQPGEVPTNPEKLQQPCSFKFSISKLISINFLSLMLIMCQCYSQFDLRAQFLTIWGHSY